MTTEQLAFRASLEPAPDHWGGTGAILIHDDGRDYPPEAHPRVREVLTVGAPNEVDRSAGVCEILNQGATGACVVFSTCTGIQADNNLDRGICYHFAAAQMYTEMGGTGQNGIDSRAELQACVDRGAPLVGGGRVKIGSYFRCDQTPGLFVEQIKAAVSSGQVVVIAMLLPSTFGGVWREGAVTDGYHQLEISGYRGDIFWGPNTWGATWPGGSGPHPPGFYECSFSYVVSQNFLMQHTYAFIYDPFEVHGPTPTPTPVPVPVPVPQPDSAIITGKVTGANINALAANDGYTLQGHGLTWPLWISQVTPGPGPGPQPDPGPQPAPGVLKVNLFRQGSFLFVNAQDAGGTYISGTVTVVFGGMSVPAYLGRNRTVNSVQAVFRLTGVSGVGVVTVTADDGRTGSVTL